MTTTLIQILLHTPRWVFAVFALLLWLGVRQMAAGRAHLNRVLVMPLAMGGLAGWGVESAFGGSPAGLAALGVWVLTALATLALVLRRAVPEGVGFDPLSREFQLPGSAVPLTLMMGIFFTKYVVGVSLAMHPELARQALMALGVSALYGVFTGLFAGRSLRLLKLALRTRVQPQAI